MKPLIEHLVRNNWSEIVTKSRRNCHVLGVDSIMLLEAPGKTIRLFIANGNHNLDRNLAGNGPLSVAFHAHHCALTLHCVYGSIVNRTISLVGYGGDTALTVFKYRSALRGESAGFDAVRKQRVIVHADRWLSAGDTLPMSARLVHTVGVSRNHRAAWLVFEGQEDSDYEPFCYSDAPLEQADMSDLYKPMQEFEILDALNSYELI